MSNQIDWDRVLTELPAALEGAYDPQLAARSIKLTEYQISHLESLADVLEDNVKLGEKR